MTTFTGFFTLGRSEPRPHVSGAARRMFPSREDGYPRRMIRYGYLLPALITVLLVLALAACGNGDY
jgi:hypothetical protein